MRDSIAVDILRWSPLKMLSCLTVLFLAGCGGGESDYDLSTNGETRASPQTPQFVDQQLLKHIAELEKSMKNFSNFFLAQDEEMKLPDRSLLTSHQVVLNRHVYIDWSGPVEQLLNDMADLTGYRAQVIGPTPCIPPIVTLHHDQITVLDVIRDAALQVHRKADLVIYPDEHLIELRYK